MKIQIVYVDGDGTETPGAVFYCRSKLRRRFRRKLVGQMTPGDPR